MEERVHLRRRLQPLLLRVAHTSRVVQVLACTEADESVVRVGIFFVDEVDIVCGNQFDMMLVRQFDQDLVYFHLMFIDRAVGILSVGRVALHFQIVILAEEVLEPQHRFLRFLELPRHNLLRYLPAEARRANNQILVIFLQQLLVDARPAIEPFRPRVGNHLNQIVIPPQRLGKHNQVPAAQVVFRIFLLPSFAGAVAFAADDGFEERRLRLGNEFRQFRQPRLLLGTPFRLRLQLLQFLPEVFDSSLHLAVLLIHLVEEFLDAEHIPVVGNGDGAHPVLRRLVEQRVDGCLPVEQRVLRMYV